MAQGGHWCSENKGLHWPVDATHLQHDEPKL
jgi:hypothetical protein